MNDIFNAYSHVIATTIVMLGIIILLWLLLVANGLFRNPLRICSKSIKKALKWIDLLENDIREKIYNRRTDSYLFLVRDRIDVLSRYIRQFGFESNDDRIDNITKRIQSINISFDILRKVYLQRGVDEALGLVVSSKVYLKEINEIIDVLIVEEKNYNNIKK